MLILLSWSLSFSNDSVTFLFFFSFAMSGTDISDHLLPMVSFFCSLEDILTIWLLFMLIVQSERPPPDRLSVKVA